MRPRFGGVFFCPATWLQNDRMAKEKCTKDVIRIAVKLKKHGALDKDIALACGVCPQTGSSPRMRGTREIGSVTLAIVGIIPVYAGNTRGKARCSPRARDHPRVAVHQASLRHDAHMVGDELAGARWTCQGIGIDTRGAGGCRELQQVADYVHVPTHWMPSSLRAICRNTRNFRTTCARLLPPCTRIFSWLSRLAL